MAHRPQRQRMAVMKRDKAVAQCAEGVAEQYSSCECLCRCTVWPMKWCGRVMATFKLKISAVYSPRSAVASVADRPLSVSAWPTANGKKWIISCLTAPSHCIQWPQRPGLGGKRSLIVRQERRRLVLPHRRVAAFHSARSNPADTAMPHRRA